MAAKPPPSSWSRLVQLERKLGWSDIIASAALIASVYAVFQSREANSPRIEVAAIPARSYLVCRKEQGEFHSRNVVLFRLSNNGGRATTFVGLAPLEGTPPVSVVVGGRSLPKPWYVLQVLNQLEEASNGFDAHSLDVEPVFASAKTLILQEKEGGNPRARPTLFDVTLDPGKSRIIAIGLTTADSEASGMVERVSLTL